MLENRAVSGLVICRWFLNGCIFPSHTNGIQKNKNGGPGASLNAGRTSLNREAQSTRRMLPPWLWLVLLVSDDNEPPSGLGP